MYKSILHYAIGKILVILMKKFSYEGRLLISDLAIPLCLHFLNNRTFTMHKSSLQDTIRQKLEIIPLHVTLVEKTSPEGRLLISDLVIPYAGCLFKQPVIYP